MSELDEPLKEHAMSEELARVRVELEKAQRELRAYQDGARSVIAKQQARIFELARELEETRAAARTRP